MSNLLNLERVSKSYGVRPLLTDVSLGIAAGERIGIVGRNGDGKTTLLEVMTGLEEPDTGRVSKSRGLLIGYLHQGDELVDTHTVREAVLATKEYDGVLGRWSFDQNGDTTLTTISGREIKDRKFDDANAVTLQAP